ncbi:MAG: flagellar hook-associated protein FlgL, partial [candidate division Zixibacteria bacterium]|nr:flagellar hook-associated protein FlgL [candidate division Zixibacteria bacterium]
HLVGERAAVGARVMRLETTAARLVSLDLTVTKLLAEVEDADMAATITELATHEGAYQAALAATARIIQPSLINFLK